MLKGLKAFSLVLAKQYTSIGGQAVIEGVMMRSPNAFVVAVRKPNGEIRLRRDQWYGLSQKIPFFKKPFLRGIIMLFEAMANGILSLNYSANIALEEEMKAEALKKGKTLEEYEAEKKKSESIDWMTFFTIALSLTLGLGLFVFVPHASTEAINQIFKLGWSLDGYAFHLIDGCIKACIFVIYIKLIGYVPDIKRVFQYHGAEHKSIATFEAGEELSIENAKKYSKLHPRCGTSFIFFLLFISIIIFSGLFTALPIGEGLPNIPKHILAVVVKICFMIPIAGVSYEIIKFAGKHIEHPFCKALSAPGMMLQRLTTREPDDSQLEVALSSIKAVLFLEENYKLKEVKNKVLSLEEIDVHNLAMIEVSNSSLTDFLE
ncbi:MAG: DUF1385 domain-containing protein [Halobacteriovoraceae bacterium]|jgi:uncharacterized protein YqhQ|nr:DUF1385 domain-containing protein [Halobacteriovoraceae bacterium]